MITPNDASSEDRYENCKWCYGKGKVAAGSKTPRLSDPPGKTENCPKCKGEKRVLKGPVKEAAGKYPHDAADYAKDKAKRDARENAEHNEYHDWKNDPKHEENWEKWKKKREAEKGAVKEAAGESREEIEKDTKEEHHGKPARPKKHPYGNVNAKSNKHPHDPDYEPYEEDWAELKQQFPHHPGHPRDRVDEAAGKVKKRAGQHVADEEAAELVGDCPKCHSKNTGFGDGPHAECKDCGHKYTKEDPVKKAAKYHVRRHPGSAGGHSVYRASDNKEMSWHTDESQAKYKADELNKKESQGLNMKCPKCGHEVNEKNEKPVKEAAGDDPNKQAEEEAWTGRKAGQAQPKPQYPAGANKPEGAAAKPGFFKGLKDRLKFSAEHRPVETDPAVLAAIEEAQRDYRGPLDLDPETSPE